MSYFSNIPYIAYKFNGKVDIVKDILVRSRFLSEYRPYSDLFELYTINDGETPDSIAYDYYGNAGYHWVILLFNEIHDVYTEWPKTSNELNIYNETTHGEDRFEVKHWVNSDGNISGEVKEYSTPWIPPANPGVPNNLEYVPVTFEEYETSLNDAKRTIRLLRIELLGEFVKQFAESMT